MSIRNDMHQLAHVHIADLCQHMHQHRILYHIPVVGCQHVRYGASQPCTILVDEFPYHLVIGHFYDVGQAVESRDVFLLAVLRILVRTFAFLIHSQIVLGVPFLQQAVYFIGHTFRETDHFVFSRLVVVYGDVVLCFHPRSQ